VYFTHDQVDIRNANVMNAPHPKTSFKNADEALAAIDAELGNPDAYLNAHRCVYVQQSASQLPV